MIYIANAIIDEKFIDSVIDTHSLTNDICTHHYFMIKELFSGEFKHIKKHENCIVVLTAQQFLEKMKSGKYNGLFLHSLFPLPLSIIPLVPGQLKIFWFAWGFDIYADSQKIPTQIYGKKLIPLQLYKQKTKSFLYPNFISRIRKQIEIYKQEQLFKRYEHKYSNALYKNAIQRIDYFSGVFPIEYQLALHCPYFKAKETIYSYTKPIPLDALCLNLGNSRDILIGNSGDPSNNHLDLFEILKDVELSDRMIYVPLSYSGSKEYVQEVIRVGKRIWGDKFIPLIDFMPKEQYDLIIKRCGFAFFFHERQQAVGNINMSIRNGCKIFVSETSIAYRHYKQIGIKIYSIQNDLEKEIENLLPVEIQESNAKILFSLYNREACKHRLLTLYNEIL